jgi:hypothetical protein
VLRNGKFKLIDGPFAETKELIAGFWLIQAKSREDAIQWAKRIPFQEGEVEIRPLLLTDFSRPAEKLDGWRRGDSVARRRPASPERNATWVCSTRIQVGVMPDEGPAAMGEFMEEAKAGVFLSGGCNQFATRGPPRGSKRTVLMGPSRNKELVVGYALLQFASGQKQLSGPSALCRWMPQGAIAARASARYDRSSNTKIGV